MNRFSTLLLFVTFLVSTIPAVSSAQSGSPTVPQELFQESPLVCSDYYALDAMQAETTFLAESAVPGLPAEFETFIINTNRVPVTDVSVIARIHKVGAAGVIEHTHEYVTVVADATFAPGESKNLSYTWNVPNALPSGEYIVSVAIVSNGQHHWLGQAFSNSALGSTAPFTVVGESFVQPILLGVSEMTVNGQAYDATSGPLPVPAGEPVIVSTVLENTSTNEVTLPLQWQQYVWSAEMNESLRNTSSELITLAPGEERVVSYTSVPQAEAVMHVTAEIQSADVRSMASVRTVQSGVDELRSGYLGVSAFPLKAGESVTAVACVQNVDQKSIEMAQVTLTLKDKNNEVIRTIDYFGSVTGVLQGYGETFTVDKNYNYLTLESTLVRNGEVQETLTVVYDCETIDPSSCLEDAMVQAETVSGQPTNILLFVGSIIIILLLIVVFVYFFRHRGTPPNQPMPPPSNPSVTLSILFFLMLVGMLPATASAQTCAPFGLSSVGYRSPSVLSDVILYQSTTPMPWENCQALCNASLGSPQTGDRYCNYASHIVGMQWGFVVPDVGLSNGTTFYTCRLSQEPLVYQNPFTGLPMGSWNGVSCPAPVAINNPPATPTITGPASGQTNTNHTFNVRSTDPDGNTLRYGIDVNNDSLVDAWLPSSGYTNSGTQLPYSRSWSSAGTFTIRAIAEDNSGARSGWATHTITVSAPQPPPPPQNSATLTGTDCTIPVGGSSCNGSVTWSVPDWNTSGFYTITRTVTNQTNSQGFVAGMTSGTRSITLTGGNNNIVLWETVSPPIITLDMNNQYAETNLRGNCAAGSSWNGSSCAAVVVAGSCTLGPEVVGDSGPTDMWGGNACLNVDDLAPFTTPSCPSGATTGTVVSTSEVITAGFCATRQVQSSQCFGTAYVRSCNGASLPPPATNQPPQAPTIIGPTSGTPGTNYQFSFTATDPNSEQIRYGVDWDFNGVIDAWLPASQYVNSGVAQTGNRTWPNEGTFSFRALTQDASGAVSGWSTHTITVTNTVANCTWRLDSSTDDFAAANSNSNMTCPATTCQNATPPVTAAMDGQPAAASAPNVCVLSCSTSGNYRYLDTMTKQGPGCAPVGASCSDAGIVYTATTNAEFAAAGASCQSLGYTQFVEAGQEDAQPGFFSNPPNGTCNAVFADTNGAIMYRYVIFSVPACIPTMTPAELPNLVPVLTQNNITPSPSVNAVMGTYNSLTLTPILRNTGNGSTLVAVPYSLRLTNQTTNTQNDHNGQVGIIAGNGTAPASFAFSTVPFGRYDIRVEADPAPGVIVESNESDNVITQNYVLPPPNPNLDLGVSPGTVVRAGTVVTLNWTVNVSYDMTCSLVGPALTNSVSFNPRTNGTAGTVTAGPITATSDYTLTCVEPITNTTFTDTTRVETIGTVQEI